MRCSSKLIIAGAHEGRYRHYACVGNENSRRLLYLLNACRGRHHRMQLLLQGVRRRMRHVAVIVFVLITSSLAVTAAERLRFWNLTGFTIKELRLAPAGTAEWGPDQCRNDPDGAVDADERLTLKDIGPGRYDVRLVDKKGRACIVRDVEVLAGKPYAFSISDKDLTDCGK